MANYAPILLLQLCRYCLWVNDITGFCPASVRMTLAYTILSPHFLLPHLWSSNYSSFMDQQCHMEAMASSYRQCQSSSSVGNVIVACSWLQLHFTSLLETTLRRFHLTRQGCEATSCSVSRWKSSHLFHRQKRKSSEVCLQTFSFLCIATVVDQTL